MSCASAKPKLQEATPKVQNEAAKLVYAKAGAVMQELRYLKRLVLPCPWLHSLWEKSPTFFSSALCPNCSSSVLAWHNQHQTMRKLVLDLQKPQGLRLVACLLLLSQWAAALNGTSSVFFISHLQGHMLSIKSVHDTICSTHREAFGSSH